MLKYEIPVHRWWWIMPTSLQITVYILQIPQKQLIIYIIITFFNGWNTHACAITRRPTLTFFHALPTSCLLNNSIERANSWKKSLSLFTNRSLFTLRWNYCAEMKSCVTFRLKLGSLLQSQVMKVLHCTPSQTWIVKDVKLMNFWKKLILVASSPPLLVCFSYCSDNSVLSLHIFFSLIHI